MKMRVINFLVVSIMRVVNLFSIWTTILDGRRVARKALSEGCSHYEAREHARGYGYYLGLKQGYWLYRNIFWEFLPENEKEELLQLEEPLKEDTEYWTEYLEGA